jgi:hypothetical protein
VEKQQDDISREGEILTSEIFPRFLTYKTTRITLSSEFIHASSTDTLLMLRNAIKACGEIIKAKREYLDEIFSFEIHHPDFRTLVMNIDMVPEIIGQLNGIIGRRNLAIRQAKLKEKKK